MEDNTLSLWYELCSGSLTYLMPIFIAVGFLPFIGLNNLQRRKVIFITIGIAFLLFINDYPVDCLHLGYINSSILYFLHKSTLIAVIFGTVYTIILKLKDSRKYELYILSGIQLTAATIGILGSFVYFEEDGWLIQFSPDSFFYDLFLLFWNSYTVLFPLNAYIPCGFFTPKNWLYFAVVQVLFNTFYLLFISYLSHWFYRHWHRSININKH
ncbi:MAG: hypothetical protein R3E32_19175 [Chitinophagales bacterium]